MFSSLKRSDKWSSILKLLDKPVSITGLFRCGWKYTGSGSSRYL